ncbi:MAG: RluA family pseudouridine synthase [Firmicutes bacterium]|nr:RluA family pseudouridine synthase [Bacillota bacterium]
MTEFKHIVTPEESGRSIKELIRHHFTFSSRLMTKLKFQNLVYLNGEPMPGWIPTQTGDILLVKMPEEASDFPPEDIPIHVIYEDDDILVLNKQAGVAVHPTKGKPDHTIANGLMKKMLDDQETGKGQPYKIRFVNRLDMNTSGLMIVAKTGFAQEEIIKQMRKNRVIKKYITVVTGEIPEEEGTIDLPLGRPYADEVERWVVPEEEGGSPSVTHYTVLDRFAGHSLVELKLDTGRTHQIRIHLSYIGYPIVGDHLYCHGNPFEYRRIHNIPKDFHEEIVSPYINRQALHARYLAFRHPVTGENLSFEAPIPDDITQLLATLSNLSNQAAADREIK